MDEGKFKEEADLNFRAVVFGDTDQQPALETTRQIADIYQSEEFEEERPTFSIEELNEKFAGRFEFLELIGTGGLSTVYKASHLGLQKLVAIKILYAQEAKAARNRFLREAQAVSNLKHENIIDILDFNCLPTGQQYLVMEYLRGETLAEMIVRRNRISLKEALDIFIQIIDAMEHAHERGIMHRDLKPNNIMLVNGLNRENEVRVLDFGLAKFTASENADENQALTKTGEVFGTPLYMSPEQCMGSKVDKRSDIYAMGCLMYESLSGVPPHHAESTLATLLMHLNEDATPLNELEGLSVPTQMQTIIDECLEKAPEKRYQTMHELLEDLRCLKTNLASNATTPLPYADSDSSKRSKREESGDAKSKPVSALKLGAILIASVAVIGAVAMLMSAQKQSETPATPHHRVMGAQQTAPPLNPLLDLKKHPEFGPLWTNASQSFDLNDLKGKIVVLDFWTSSCINCINVMPELQKLQGDFEKEVVVVGIHSGSFSAERNSKTIQKAVQRYGITYPVLNDAENKIMDSYGVQYWPTEVLVSPDGKIIGRFQGDTSGPALRAEIVDYIKEHPSEFTAEPFKYADRKLTPTELRFPSKAVLASDGKTLLVSDTGNDRVVAIAPNGHLLKEYGSAWSSERRNFHGVQLKAPQGLVCDGNQLFIADTGNNLVRVMDLASGRSNTIAGTGQLASQVLTSHETPALNTALSSPLDLYKLGPYLYVTMAGAHQIGRIDLRSGMICAVAGSGIEGLKDGTSTGAELAQPRGLTSDGKNLYFVDSESSTVRQFQPDNGKVTTIVSGGLETFGDKSGPFAQAKLQLPLDLAWSNGLLYVADTYNNKIKILNLNTKQAIDLAGSGAIGAEDGNFASFFEPNSVLINGKTLYVIDTNNNAIRTIDVTDGTVNTLKVNDPEAE